MRIKQLRIKNFTSIVDINLETVPDLVVLIGKNSSGKSNLIDTLELFFKAFGPDISAAIGEIDEYQHLFRNHSAQNDNTPSINITLSLTTAEWGQVFNVDPRVVRSFEKYDLRVTKEIVISNDIVYWSTPYIHIEGHDVVIFGLIIEPTLTLNTNTTEQFLPPTIEVDVNEFISRLASLLDSSFKSVRAGEGMRIWDDRFGERPTILQPEQIDALWELSQSKGNHRQIWTRMVRQYEGLAPNEQKPAGVVSSIQLDEGNLSVPIGMAGEGSQSLLGIIENIERGPSIMAIEEPEIHLHPSLVKQVGRLFMDVAKKGKQLFVCTHSPFLVEQSSLESLFVVQKDHTGTNISPVQSVSALQNMLFDIGMKPSDILFSDAILLVEGLADEIFFNRLSNKCNVPLASRHIKLIKAGGYPRGRHKIEFWGEVGKDAGLPLYLIFDNNASDEATCAIEQGLVPAERCLILARGNLEDHYPWHVLQRALQSKFDVEVTEEIPFGNRVKALRNLLSKKGQGENTWKPLLAEEVSELITPAEAQAEMSDVVSFLRKVYHDVGI